MNERRRKSAVNNKICQDCGKEFVINSNRNRQFNLFHLESADGCESELGNELPTMVPVVISNNSNQNVDEFGDLQNDEVDLTRSNEASNELFTDADNDDGITDADNDDGITDGTTYPPLSEPINDRAKRIQVRTSCG